VIAIPHGLPDDPELPTRSIFEMCLGRAFVVAGFNEIGMAELEIQSTTGSVGETIWVETRFLR